MKWIVLLLLIVLSACSGGSKAPVIDPMTGTDGVVITQEYAPNDVYEGEDFELVYYLENKGLSTIASTNPGSLIVTYDKLYLDYLGTLSRFSNNQFTLYPRTRYTDGETAAVSLLFQSREIQRNSAIAQTDVLLTACYPYHTNTTSQVCIERNRNTQPGAVVCTDADIRPESSGAPIGVKSIETRTRRTVSDNKEVAVIPSFRITLINYGDGIPSLGSCDSSEKLNKAVVRASLLDQELECGIQSDPNRIPGEVTFIRKEAQLNCEVPLGAPIARGESNFISLLSVEIDYIYRESIQTEVVIINE